MQKAGRFKPSTASAESSREPSTQRGPTPNCAHPDPCSPPCQRAIQPPQSKRRRRHGSPTRHQAPPLRCRLPSHAHRPRTPTPARLLTEATHGDGSPNGGPPPKPHHATGLLRGLSRGGGRLGHRTSRRWRRPRGRAGRRRCTDQRSAAQSAGSRSGIVPLMRSGWSTHRPNSAETRVRYAPTDSGWRNWGSATSWRTNTLSVPTRRSIAAGTAPTTCTRRSANR